MLTESYDLIYISVENSIKSKLSKAMYLLEEVIIKAS